MILHIEMSRVCRSSYRYNTRVGADDVYTQERCVLMWMNMMIEGWRTNILWGEHEIINCD
jgi:hypothetical protein